MEVTKCKLPVSPSDTEERSGSNASTLDLPLEDRAEGGSSRHIVRTMHPKVPSSFATLEPKHSAFITDNMATGPSQFPPTRIYDLRPRKPLLCATSAGSSKKRKRQHLKCKGPGADLPCGASITSGVFQASGSSQLPPRTSSYHLRPRKQLAHSIPAGASKRKRKNPVKFKSPKASTSSVSPIIDLSGESSDNFNSPKDPSSSLHPAIQISDLQFLSVIGEGLFAKVWFTRLLTNNTACAVKVIRNHPYTYFESEVECMRRVDPSFPFIVQLYGHFSDWRYVFLVLEYIGFGSIMDHLNRYGALPESHVKLYIAEVGCALQHLHDHQIVHRDLHADNVLLAADGHVKLIDFGLSRVVTNGEAEFKPDWYNLGMLMFRMLTGGLPLDEKSNIPEEFSEECRDLLQQLLGTPESRLGGFLNLLGHQWFKGYHPESVQLKLYQPRYIPSARRALQLSDFHPYYENPGAKDLRLTNKRQSTFLKYFIPMPDAQNDECSESNFDEEEE